jgi:hypothetical protein
MFRYILMCVVLGIGLLSATSAGATNQSAAVELCKKNPSCGLNKGPGGVNLWVETPGGGRSEVYCPDQGECTCLSCGAPTRQRLPDIGYVISPQIKVPQSISSSGNSAPAPTAAPTAPGPYTDGPALP